MSTYLKHCCRESNASPLNSDAIRSGLSSMIFLSLTCFSELCHEGTRCNICLHSVDFPFSLQLEHASSTLNVLKIGSCVRLSFILMSLE